MKIKEKKKKIHLLVELCNDMPRIEKKNTRKSYEVRGKKMN